uniref:BTB domain-containing protein n=1 Tax=Romanomermis culicivorax TaxID=13658 RepID=A0A915JEM8_ROMCU
MYILTQLVEAGASYMGSITKETPGFLDVIMRIPAHKFVLSVGSAVFDAMFNGAMAVQNQDDIELPDVEPAAFLALLKFLYSDDFQIGPESVMTTLYTAKKYAVPALEHACVDFLKRNLNPDNAFMLLTQARLFDEPTLAKLCFEMIDKHTTESLNAEGFTDIDLDTLSAVMERDTLRIREVVLFQAVVRWSVEVLVV